MPKQVLFAWQDRAAIFRAFRANGGKVLPIAKERKLARSTIGKVVEELIAQGFPRRARLQGLTEETRRGLQRYHTGQVFGKREGLLMNISQPESGRALEGVGPPAGADLLWHLRGSGAARLLEEAQLAVEAYEARCTRKLGCLAEAVAEACRVPLGHIKPYTRPDELVVDLRLADYLWSTLFGARLEPPSEWGRQRLAQGGCQLNAPGNIVAVAPDQSDFASLIEDMGRFVDQRLTRFRTAAMALQGEYQDLLLLRGLVHDSIAGVTPEEVAQGICPWCPFPEISGPAGGTGAGPAGPHGAAPGAPGSAGGASRRRGRRRPGPVQGV